MTAAKSERDKAILPAQVEAADQCAENTDRELYREPDKGHGSYYSDSIHVTQRGGIGINCSGTVIVKPLREWHKLAAAQAPGQQASAVGEEEKIEQAFKEILKVWRAQRSTLPMPQIEWAELAARAVLALIQRSYSGGGEAAPTQQTPEGWRDIASAPKKPNDYDNPVDIWAINRQTGKGHREIDCHLSNKPRAWVNSKGNWFTGKHYYKDGDEHYDPACTDESSVVATHWMKSFPPPPLASTGEGEKG